MPQVRRAAAIARVAAAAGDVEHALAGDQVERFGQMLGGVVDEVGDHREVAFRPDLLLDLGDRLEVRCVVHLSSSLVGPNLLRSPGRDNF